MRLLRNSLSNFMGAALPAAANLLAIPYVLAVLGERDFGLLTLVGAIVGYFALLDINVSGGAVRFVSYYESRREAHRANQVVSLGAVLYLVIGVAGALAIAAGAEILAIHVFAVDADRLELAVAVLRVAALGFLFGQLQQYLTSVGQGLQRYDLTGRLEALFGVGVPAGTVAVLYVGMGIYEVVVARVVLSIVHGAALAVLIRQVRPETAWAVPDGSLARELMVFSGYAYLARVAAVTYLHADKLVVGALLGTAAVTHYAIPATLVGRVLGLTYRLGSVTYPLTAAVAARGDYQALRRVYLRAGRYLTSLNAFLVLMAVLYGDHVLRLWVGAEMADVGYPVLALVALAGLVDSLSNLPSMANDGLGHPRVTGLFALARAFVGVVLISAGSLSGGVAGAAAGQFMASVVFVGAFVVYVHGRTVPVTLRDVVAQCYAPTLVLVTLAGAVGLVPWAALLGPAGTAVGAVMVAATYGTGLLFGVLAPEDRHRVRAWVFQRRALQRP